ncbi:hypothetical protein DFH27DRAFT_525802 [Peziza echinospora]|nr:hypothetical protein DFH27DRAFT_525802 [Peziza echinospora]
MGNNTGGQGFGGQNSVGNQGGTGYGVQGGTGTGGQGGTGYGMQGGTGTGGQGGTGYDMQGGTGPGMQSQVGVVPRTEMVASLELLADFLDEEEDDDMILTSNMVDALYGTEEAMYAGFESEEDTFMVDKRARANSVTDSDERNRHSRRRRVEDDDTPTLRAPVAEASATRTLRGGAAIKDAVGKKIDRRAKKTPMEKMDEKRSIRMMQGVPRWDYIDALRSSTVTVPWGTLMDLAPNITGGIA